jgi:hypothetical protein|eukprot:COSAG06_NODE_484_length_15127_cov_3.402116_9_plen_546_part_00
MAEEKAAMEAAKAEMQAAADAEAQAAAAVAADKAAVVAKLGDLSALQPPPPPAPEPDPEPAAEEAPAEGEEAAAEEEAPAEEAPAEGEEAAAEEEAVEEAFPPINADVYTPAIEAILANTCYTSAYIASVSYEMGEPGEPGEDGEPTPAVETAVLTYIAANEADSFLVGTTLKGEGVSGGACTAEKAVVEIPNVLNSEIKYFKTPKFGAYICAPIVDFSGKARLVLCADSLASGATTSADDTAFVASVASALSPTSHPMPMKALPAEPAGTMCIVECDGGPDKGADGHRADTMHLANAVIDKGWSVTVVVYSDATAEAVKEAVDAAQSVIVRAIEVPDGLAAMLGEVSAAKTVSPSPALAEKFADASALTGSGLSTAPPAPAEPEPPAEPAEGEEEAAPAEPAAPPAPVEASLRVSMIFDTPVLITQKSSDTNRTQHSTGVSVESEEYAALVEAWKADIPGLMGAVGLDTTPLPLVWSVDFGVVKAPEPAEGEEPAPDSYQLCAFDMGCVGVSDMLHVVPAVADAAVAIAGTAPAADVADAAPEE